MERYTASYGSIRDNFAIINIDSQQIRGPLYGILCVVENIIQRGNPTIPSLYLQEKTSFSGESGSEDVYLISKETPVWNNIKGDDEHLYYPAEEFYYNILPKYLGDLAIVRNLIIPEADFHDIIGRSSAFDNRQADFYFPQIRTVIEIDGGQHAGRKQKYKDSQRDKILKINGISVIRIKTKDMREESDTFIEKMKLLTDEIRSSGIADRLITPDRYDEIEDTIRIDSIMRLQILILELLKSGMLQLTDDVWKFCFRSSDVKDIGGLLQTAYEDIKRWITPIAQLIKAEIHFPELKTLEAAGENAVTIDFSIFRRYTDAEEKDSSCIYIRNDYFHGYDLFRISNADTLAYVFTPETQQEDDRSLKYILNNLFPDIEDFRDGQPQIIRNVLMRNDTIGILPTGTGKSLCYQFAAMLQPGVSIVVVPIISLMQDQKESMKRRNFAHVNSISSVTTGFEREIITDKFLHGGYQFLWISPERFQNEEFRSTLTQINEHLNFALAVIDEVHCLSEWGHDFRVSYLSLIKLLKEFCPEAVILGLTATASQAVLEDLKAEFEVDGSAVKALTDMDRPELNFHRIRVRRQTEKAEEIYRIISKNDHKYTNADGVSHNSIGLIFCPTVNGKTGCLKIENQINELAKKDLFHRQKLRVASYHGKLTTAERTEIQTEFMNDKFDVLACTKAFGMGIDQPHVKYTIHDSMPQSIESFYQEAGRAGRDKDKSVKSDCYILYCPESSESTVSEIFDPDTTIEQRKELSEGLHGDLNTIMWFWNNNRETRRDEYKNIRSVLTHLYKGEYQIHFDKSSKYTDLETIQKALYKLSILGVVENWTVDYASLDRGTVNVEYAGVDESGERHRRCLLEYIHKYDPQFQFDERRKDYSKYYDIAHDNSIKPFARMMNILIEWTNENIMNNRLQSTYNMMQWLSPDISDLEFRTRIREYFRFSEETVVYDGIIYHPLEYNNWFDLLFTRDEQTMMRTGSVISTEEADKRLAGLQRYLESYRFNTGLNFLSGLLRMYTGRFRGTEGEWRIDSAFQNICEQMDEESQDDLIDETLKFADNFDISGKDDISALICRYFPEKDHQVFRALNDRYSLSIILENDLTKINRIMEALG